MAHKLETAHSSFGHLFYNRVLFCSSSLRQLGVFLALSTRKDT